MKLALFGRSLSVMALMIGGGASLSHIDERQDWKNLRDPEAMASYLSREFSGYDCKAMKIVRVQESAAPASFKGGSYLLMSNQCRDDLFGQLNESKSFAPSADEGCFEQDSRTGPREICFEDKLVYVGSSRPG